MNNLLFGKRKKTLELVFEMSAYFSVSMFKFESVVRCVNKHSKAHIEI